MAEKLSAVTTGPAIPLHAASTPGASCSRGQQGSQSTRSVLVLLKVDRSRDWDRSRAPVISGQVKPKAVQRAKRKKVLVERDRKSIQGYMLLPRQAKLHAWQQFPCPWSAVHAGVAKCCHPRPTSSGTKHIIAAILCCSHGWQPQTVWHVPAMSIANHVAHTGNTQSPPASIPTQPQPAAAATTPPASTAAQAETSGGARGWPAGVLASVLVLPPCRTPRGLLPYWRQDGQSPAHVRRS